MWNTPPCMGKISGMILKLIYRSCLNERRKGRDMKLNLGVHHNACVSNSPMDASSIAHEAMSSEEVTVDHARSMVMNPQVVAVDQTRSMAANTKKAAEDQTESTTTNPEGSTVDHSRSTVMNSEEEDAVDQTESTARKRKESTTAEPNLTSKEELEVINLSNDPNVNKPISISSLCYNTQVASAANIIPQVGISSAVRITKI
uniref:Uncharacterized protein n=1 Tax=Fagus sylvatica TaxID=28930 RepID=A0A2N9EEI1_FAGSY